MEKPDQQQTGNQDKTQRVEQINICLHSGDYARALELLRGTAAEFPNNAELSELEKLAHDGVKRNAEANRLITESQELFAQRKSADAIQLLRQAYELDKNNSLARAILANALVEHAQSLVETDWLEAETLTNQALKLNPAHPTAKTIHGLIVNQKKASSVEDWVARARTLQSSGDLFAALAWVAEGLAVHPDDPKLLQTHDAIQRDQGARRRQARRGDMESLRRMEIEIDKAADVAAKQAIAERVQAMAAKYWTDGEFLSIANRLLHRLGLARQENSATSPNSKGSTVIFHVPRSGAQEASHEAARRSAPTTPSPVRESPVLPQNLPAATIPTREFPPDKVPPSKVPPSIAPERMDLATLPQAATPPAAEAFEPPAKITSPPPLPEKPASSNSTLILISTAAVFLMAVTFFVTRRHYAPPIVKTQSATPTISATDVSAATPATPVPATSVPATAATPAPEPISPVPPAPLRSSSDTGATKVGLEDQPPADSGRKLGTLLVVAGQDDVKVLLDGNIQTQRTQAGQLLLPNLERKDYVVQVSKSGFQDPPSQKVQIRKGEQATLVFQLQPQNLQPQPLLASLNIRGGLAGTAVLIDRTLAGTVQPDGTLSVSTVNPGDHTVELRKEGFKPRELKEHFVAGETISMAAADAALEGAPGILTIAFAPADATVALVKGELLKMVSSGVPLNLSAGTYTLTARTAERFTRTSTVEVMAGQSKTLNLSLAPGGMSQWDDPGAWKHEGDAFIRKGGDFVLYGAVPASGTYVFSAMPAKGRLLQWVVNYSDPKNYVLFQMDEDNFYRTVIRNGQKTSEIKVPDKGDKKSFRTLQIHVSPTELVHQIRHGDRSIVLDRWTQPGANLSLGKFGFYIPGNDQVTLSSFAHYGDLNIR